MFLLMAFNIPLKSVNDRMLPFFSVILKALFILVVFDWERNMGFMLSVKIKGKPIAPGSTLSCSLLTLEGSVCKDTRDCTACTLLIC